MVVHEGDIFWYDFGVPRGSEPGFRRPVLVIQGEIFNATSLPTVVVCALTSNQTMGRFTGNVVLFAGEAGLDRASVAVVTQIFTVDRSYLEEYVGTLPYSRLHAVRWGVRLVLGDEDAIDILW